MQTKSINEQIDEQVLNFTSTPSYSHNSPSQKSMLDFMETKQEKVQNSNLASTPKTSHAENNNTQPKGITSANFIEDYIKNAQKQNFVAVNNNEEGKGAKMIQEEEKELTPNNNLINDSSLDNTSTIKTGDTQSDTVVEAETDAQMTSDNAEETTNANDTEITSTDTTDTETTGTDTTNADTASETSEGSDASSSEVQTTEENVENADTKNSIEAGAGENSEVETNTNTEVVNADKLNEENTARVEVVVNDTKNEAKELTTKNEDKTITDITKVGVVKKTFRPATYDIGKIEEENEFVIITEIVPVHNSEILKRLANTLKMIPSMIATKFALIKQKLLEMKKSRACAQKAQNNKEIAKTTTLEELER